MFLVGVDSFRCSSEPDPKTGSRSVSLAKQEGAYDFEDTQRSENRGEFVACSVTPTTAVNQTKVEESTSGGNKPVSSFAGTRLFGDISRFTMHEQPRHRIPQIVTQERKSPRLWRKITANI